jgi:D-glycero-D-manno-heptose 1,7-bisphosphate phosphatase
MLAAVRVASGRIDGVLLCPHAPDEGCECRKPLPGLLLEAARIYEFEPRRALVIGDMVRDVEAARAIGATPLLIRPDRQRPPEVGSDVAVAESLWEVANQLVSCQKDH